MKELTAKEKTIWNLAMTGGQVQLKDGRTVTLIGVEHESESVQQRVIYKTKEGKFYKTYFYETTPILHSLNKLTEPVLEGGKVPIDELRKKFKSNLDVYCTQQYGISLDIDTENYSQTIDLYDGYKIIDQLRQWGFNIENLPEGTYVEKSTLKL